MGRAAIQIVGCAVTVTAGCAAISVGLAAAGVWAAGGALGDAIQAVAMSFASMASFAVAGNVVSGLASAVVEGAKLGVEAATAAFTVIKAGVHGAVGGALSVAQGGNFLEGFADSAISAFGSVLVGGTDYNNGLIGTSGDGNVQGMIARTSIVAAVGCAGAVLSGGKCGNGAITAAFAHLFNAEGLVEPQRPHGHAPLCADFCPPADTQGPQAYVHSTPEEQEFVTDVMNTQVGVLSAPVGAAGLSPIGKTAKNIIVDGPSKGLKYGNGRILGIRFRKQPIFRIDFHPIPRSNGASRLHIHVGRDMGKHYSIDPRNFFDK